MIKILNIMILIAEITINLGNVGRYYSKLFCLLIILLWLIINLTI